MKVEVLTVKDEDEIRKIWAKYYHDEFAFPDFFHHFLCAFKIVNDSNQIITAGGVRTIPEVVLVTDKDYTALTRMRALRNALDFVRHIAYKNRYDHFHATSSGNKEWEKALHKYGFRDCQDKWLVRNT